MQRSNPADRRLTPHGRRVGLINDAAWTDFLAKQERLKAMRELLERTRVNGEMPELLERFGESTAGVTIAQLLKRPEVRIEELAPLLEKLMPGFFERVDSGPWIDRNNPHSDPTIYPLTTIHYPLPFATSLSPSKPRSSTLATLTSRPRPSNG